MASREKNYSIYFLKGYGYILVIMFERRQKPESCSGPIKLEAPKVVPIPRKDGC